MKRKRDIYENGLTYILRLRENCTCFDKQVKRKARTREIPEKKTTINEPDMREKKRKRVISSRYYSHRMAQLPKDRVTINKVSRFHFASHKVIFPLSMEKYYRIARFSCKRRFFIMRKCGIYNGPNACKDQTI